MELWVREGKKAVWFVSAWISEFVTSVDILALPIKDGRLGPFKKSLSSLLEGWEKEEDNNLENLEIDKWGKSSCKFSDKIAFSR